MSRSKRTSRQWTWQLRLCFVTNLVLSCFAQASGIKSTEMMTVDGLGNIDARLTFLSDNFRQLPEKQISVNPSKTFFAQYADPSIQYGHGILGDAIEGKRLVVLKDKDIYTLGLSEEYVFEDIAPRLIDIDKDGELEIVTIRTHMNKGAGIMIYKIVDHELREFAWVDEIGRPNRWLNIAAIYDLDQDGILEIAWIQTPHIGGILKVAKFEPGTLRLVAQTSVYSNHSIGESNLCLSVVAQRDDVTTLYVPTQDRREIVGFQFADESLQKTESVLKNVNFSYPLSSQHEFNNIVQENNGCAGL